MKNGRKSIFGDSSFGLWRNPEGIDGDTEIDDFGQVKIVLFRNFINIAAVDFVQGRYLTQRKHSAFGNQRSAASLTGRSPLRKGCRPGGYPDHHLSLLGAYTDPNHGPGDGFISYSRIWGPGHGDKGSRTGSEAYGESRKFLPPASSL